MNQFGDDDDTEINEDGGGVDTPTGDKHKRQTVPPGSNREENEFASFLQWWLDWSPRNQRPTLEHHPNGVCW